MPVRGCPPMAFVAALLMTLTLTEFWWEGFACCVEGSREVTCFGLCDVEPHLRWHEITLNGAQRPSFRYTQSKIVNRREIIS